MCCCYKQVVDAYGYGEAVVPLSSVQRTIGGHNPSVRLLLSMALPSFLALSTPLAGVGIPLNQLRSGYMIQPGVTSVWRVDPRLWCCHQQVMASNFRHLAGCKDGTGTFCC